MKWKVLTTVVLAYLLLLMPVFALTGSIGNSRMILNLEPGETIERYILVKNVNDVAVDIDIGAAGDLADSVELQDEEFTLEPGEDKKAYFTITAQDSGVTETRINVRFTPIDGGNGVGLSSQIIIALGDEDGSDDGGDDGGVNVDSQNPGTIENGFQLNKVHIILFSSTLIIMLMLVVLLILDYKTRGKIKNKKRAKSK